MAGERAALLFTSPPYGSQRNYTTGGIGDWDGAVCEPTVENIVKASQHAVQVAGAARVALGSDFDGATRTPFDTRGLAAITDGLLTAGMDQETIARVMGGNTRDFL